MNLIEKLLLWLMTAQHSHQFVFPDMIMERKDSNIDLVKHKDMITNDRNKDMMTNVKRNKDMITSVRNKDMAIQGKGTARDMVTNVESKDLIDKIIDMETEVLEKDIVSLNTTFIRRDQGKNGEKNQLRNDFSALNLIEDQPVCGNGTDFCSDPITYPSKAIRKALRKQKRVIKSMFDTDLFRLRFRSGIDLYHGGENVCSMSTTHIMPKAARNKKGQFKFLVNGGEGSEDYIQLVKISQCLGAGEACGKGKIFTREVTECRQEYTDHKLVALDEEGKELIVDTFSFPSCCSCIMQTGLEL